VRGVRQRLERLECLSNSSAIIPLVGDLEPHLAERRRERGIAPEPSLGAAKLCNGAFEISIARMCKRDCDPAVSTPRLQRGKGSELFDLVPFATKRSIQLRELFARSRQRRSECDRPLEGGSRVWKRTAVFEAQAERVVRFRERALKLDGVTKG